MDWDQNFSFSGGLRSDCKKSDEVSEFGTLDDLFAIHSSEGDAALEWLSTFVEDCLTSTGNICLPPEPEMPTDVQSHSCPTAPAKSSTLLQSERVQKATSVLHRIAIPGKARSKRKRRSTSSKASTSIMTSWSYHLNPQAQNYQLISSDPPLLQQAYWLADSELIKPENKEEKISRGEGRRTDILEETIMLKEESWGSLEASKGQLQPRRCTHCQVQRTPQWRVGPLGPKTLCNACGLRHKSGGLFPEYRPAKSPTFMNFKHSNSHKKVMDMRKMKHNSVTLHF